MEWFEGGSIGKEHTYIYSWFTLSYRRNQYNIAKQLSSNLIKKLEKKYKGSYVSILYMKNLLRS